MKLHNQGNPLVEHGVAFMGRYTFEALLITLAGDNAVMALVTQYENRVRDSSASLGALAKQLELVSSVL